MSPGVPNDCSVDVSPDGRYMIVAWLERPYSFNVPCGRFPRRVQLWNADGGLVSIRHEVCAGVCVSVVFARWYVSGRVCVYA
jgi:hypothetical protein